MITEATEQQWQQIAELRESILTGITDQPSDEEIRDVVRTMWRRMGLEPKAILIADCPVSGAMMLGWTMQLSNRLKEGREKAVEAANVSRLNAVVAATAPENPGQLMMDQLGLDLYLRLVARSTLSASRQIVNRLREVLEFTLAVGLDAQMHKQLREALGERLHSETPVGLAGDLVSQIDSQLDPQLRGQIRQKLIDGLHAPLYEKIKQTLEQMAINDDIAVKLGGEVGEASTPRKVEKAIRTGLEANLYAQLVSQIDLMISGPLHSKLFHPVDDVVGAVEAVLLDADIADQLNRPAVDEMSITEFSLRLRRVLFDLVEAIGDKVSDQLGRADYDKLDVELHEEIRQHAGRVDGALHDQLVGLFTGIGCESDRQFGCGIGEALDRAIDRLIATVDVALGEELDSSIDKLTAELAKRVRTATPDQLDPLGANFNGQLDHTTGAKLRVKLFHRLFRRVHNNLGGQVSSQIVSKISDETLVKIRNQLYVSIGWRAWSGWYEGAEILGVQFDKEKLDLFKKWTTHVPIIYANEAIPVVIRFPKKVGWKDSVLHRDDGPAVQFRSDWGLWVIDGITVDEQIVMRPETQTVEQIDKEENGDVRAIRIERFGWPRYIAESGAEERDSRHNDIEGTEEALFRCKDGSQRLVVTCPTGRIFALGVPAENVDTCEQAQHWLAGGNNFRVIART